MAEQGGKEEGAFARFGDAADFRGQPAEPFKERSIELLGEERMEWHSIVLHEIRSLFSQRQGLKGLPIERSDVLLHKGGCPFRRASRRNLVRAGSLSRCALFYHNHGTPQFHMRHRRNVRITGKRGTVKGKWSQRPDSNRRPTDYKRARERGISTRYSSRVPNRCLLRTTSLRFPVVPNRGNGGRTRRCPGGPSRRPWRPRRGSSRKRRRRRSGGARPASIECPMP